MLPYSAKGFKADDDVNRISKSHHRPLVVDFFDDGDPRVEGGDEEFHELNRQYVAVVNYLYDPTSGRSINDLFMQTISMFYALKSDADPLKKVLVSPYLPYLRAHSVDKYRQQGFIEADRLEIFADMLALAKVEDVFSIHPHSYDIVGLLKNRGIKTHMKDTFKNDMYTDHRKLGYSGRSSAQHILDKLQPVVREISKIKQEAEAQGSRFYVVVPDDGAEELVETLAVHSGVSHDYIINILKDRHDAGYVEIKGFKDFVHSSDLEGATCVIADDMTSSGGTQETIAKYLKDNHGISTAVGIVTHAVCPDRSSIENLRYVDHFIALDTIPQDIKAVEFLEGASADILAASLMRSFRREMAKLGDSLPVINGYNNHR